jgi:hypothetical protein
MATEPTPTDAEIGAVMQLVLQCTDARLAWDSDATAESYAAWKASLAAVRDRLARWGQPSEAGAENLELRRMLCVAHAGAAAYMDDGEAQDNRDLPMIDFLRDSPPEIRDKLNRRALKKLTTSQPTASQAAESVPAPAAPRTDWAQRLQQGLSTHDPMPAPAATPGAVRVCPECDIAGCRHLRAQAPAAGAVAGPWEDHQTREIVNQLRDCAKEFHATQQLRERLLDVLGPMIDWVRAAQAPTSAAQAGREGMGMKPQVKIGWVVCNRDGKLMFCPVNELA